MKNLLRRLRAALRPVPRITTAPARRHRPAALVASFAPSEHRAAVTEITARGAELAEPLAAFIVDPTAEELADGDRRSPSRAAFVVYAPSSQAGLASFDAFRYPVVENHLDLVPMAVAR